MDVNTTHLRFREGPGQDYAVIGKLYKGAKVVGDKNEYEHNQSDWLKVKQEGSEKIGYVHKDYIRPYSTEYYVNLSEEYFPLQVGNYWMYHVEPGTQDLLEYEPKKLEIKYKATLEHDGEKALVFVLRSEDDNLIKLWVELLGEDGDNQIHISEGFPKYNSFVRKGATVYFGKYDGKLELGPVVFDPESHTLPLIGGEAELSYLHEKDFEDIRYADRGKRVAPNFPVCQYRYLSQDLSDDLNPQSRAVFAKGLGMYEITSTSDAVSGVMLCGVVIDGEEYLTEQMVNAIKEEEEARIRAEEEQAAAKAKSNYSDYLEEDDSPLDIEYSSYRVKTYDDTAVRIFLNARRFYLQPDGRTSIRFNDMGTTAKASELRSKITEYYVELQTGYRSATLTLTKMSDYSAFKLELSNRGWLHGANGIVFKPM